MTTPDLVLYDIRTAPPITQTCCSPNPWKSRFALNFKSLPYTTSWTSLPTISTVRQSLGLTAGRQFADGSDFHTLPILTDAATNAVVGDSFEIAVYLEKNHPVAGAGSLFPEQDLNFTFEAKILVPLSQVKDEIEYKNYAEWNASIDALFTASVQLTTEHFPFDPETWPDTQREWIRRAAPYGVTKWDDFKLSREARMMLLEKFEKSLEGLAKMYRRNESGPFLMGAQASYADLIVGAWLMMYSRAMPEWEEVRMWHGGVFGRLFDALQVFATVD